MKGLTDIPGIRVGHASDYDALTGCTVVLCDGGAVAGVDVSGSAAGAEEIETLRPYHIAQQIHGIVLAGGSAFGLEAASGVRRFLEARRVGFQTGAALVPIVPCAILYDLAIGKAHVRPTREMGESAAAAATGEAVREGAVGAGTGATVGKILGMRHAMKSGLGSATVALASGVKVSSLVVVNALGDVRDPEDGRLLAGARTTPDGREFADTEEQMKRGLQASFKGNTTLVVVATNARLSKVGAGKLARMAGLGMARTIRPVNTTVDGDVVFALSAGGLEADLNTLGVMAAESVAQSIARAVKAAPGMGGLPGLARR